MNSLLGFRSSLLRCARMMSDEVNTILLPHQLNYSLWQVMFVIQEKNGCTSIEMAEHLNVSKPAIAKRTHALMQMDIVAQVKTDDKRQKKLVLTASGKMLYHRCAAQIDEFEQRLLAPYASAKIHDALELIHQLMRSLESQKNRS